MKYLDHILLGFIFILPSLKGNQFKITIIEQPSGSLSNWQYSEGMELCHILI